MKILIQGAMEVELKYLLNNINNIEKLVVDGYNFWKGNLNKNEIILSETSIGTINSAIATFIGIKEFKPDFIINQGISGGQEINIHRNDLVIGTACVNINSYETQEKEKGEGSNSLEWTIKKFVSDDSIESDDIFIKTDEILLERTKKIAENYKNSKIHFGILGSGDVWNKEVDRILWLNKELNIISSDMESVGTYTIANKYNIPAIGIRAISDNSLLKEDYERNLANGAQEFVLFFINSI